MGKTPGAKNITQNQREDIKGFIRQAERNRFTYAETLEYLEDKGFDISEATLINLKAELKADMKTRFKTIGIEELGYEHLQAIDTLKDLEREMVKDLKRSVDPIERQRISAEIRAIRKDMAEFYSGTEIVDSVYKYMTEEQEAKKQGEVQKIRDKKK